MRKIEENVSVFWKAFLLAIFTMVFMQSCQLKPAFSYNPVAGQIKTKTTAFNSNLSSADSDVQKALDTLDNISYVAPNAGITAATKTKITYDTKGLVTSGADATTSDIGEGSNLYYTQGRFDTAFAAKSTSNLSEGSNSYFTNERVDDRVAALIQNGTGITWSYDDPNGTLTPTVSITQYTDALARASISETVAGLGYSSSTGVLSLTSGYVIPTTTEESNWDTAYAWGNHALAGYLTSETDPQVATVTSGNFCKGTGAAVSCSDSSTYLTAESDPVFSAVDHHVNWDTAYGWGNHASAGYLTGVVVDSPLSGSGTSASHLVVDLSGKISTIADPNANRVFGWDDTDNDYKFFTIGDGLSYDHATHTLSSSGGGGGSGDITSVGDVASGAAFDGSAGTTLTFLKENGANIKVDDSITADTEGGSLNIKSGWGTGTANGGSILIQAGKGGLTSGNGGAFEFDGGDAGGGDANGGDIVLFGGLKSGSGINGRVMIENHAGFHNAIFDPESLTADRTFAFPDKDGTFAMLSDIGGGSGDITAVGDVTSGAAFDGTAGSTLTFLKEVTGSIKLADSTTADTQGSGMNITGANGNGTANGGGIAIYSGNGGTDGLGGDMEFGSGAGNGNGNGGIIYGYGGAGSGTGIGGSFSFNAGNGGETAKGGNGQFTAGNGGSTSGDGGNVSLKGGNASSDGKGGAIALTAGNAKSIVDGTPRKGGNLSLIAGDATGGDGAGGDVTIHGGVAGAIGDGGHFTLSGADGGTTSGNGGGFQIGGGGTTSGSGGVVEISAGNSSDGYNGSDVSLTAGTGGTGDGAGGGINITSGAGGTGGDTNGGNLTITLGAKSGAGTDGILKINGVKDAGLIIQTGANTVCTTTCTQTCLVGFDTGVLGVSIAHMVSCSDATADECLCSQ